MQYVTKKRCVYCAIRQGKMFTVERSIINRRFGSSIQVDAYDVRACDCRQVVRDKAITATNVEYPRIRWNQTRDFERHVVGTANLASPDLPTPPSPDAVKKTRPTSRGGVETDSFAWRN